MCAIGVVEVTPDPLARLDERIVVFDEFLPLFLVFLDPRLALLLLVAF